MSTRRGVMDGEIIKRWRNYQKMAKLSKDGEIIKRWRNYQKMAKLSYAYLILYRKQNQNLK